MKKTKFLALTLAVAIMLMGAGYAYWTDTLTIHNSISTGFLDVDFDTSLVEAKYCDDTADTVDTANVMQASASVGTDGIDAGEQDANNDKLTVTVSNLYPNSRYEVTGKIVNSSTIPVDVNAINYTLSGLPASNNDIRTNLVMEVYVNDTLLTIPVENTTSLQTITLPTELQANKILKEANALNTDEMPVKVVVKLLNGAPNTTTEDVDNIILTVTPSFKQFNHTSGY